MFTEYFMNSMFCHAPDTLSAKVLLSPHHIASPQTIQQQDMITNTKQPHTQKMEQQFVVDCHRHCRQCFLSVRVLLLHVFVSLVLLFEIFELNC